MAWNQPVLWAVGAGLPAGKSKTCHTIAMPFSVQPIIADVAVTDEVVTCVGGTQAVLQFWVCSVRVVIEEQPEKFVTRACSVWFPGITVGTKELTIGLLLFWASDRVRKYDTVLFGSPPVICVFARVSHRAVLLQCRRTIKILDRRWLVALPLPLRWSWWHIVQGLE